jgi:hypothetical protein
MPNSIEKFNQFENKNRAIIYLIIKPLLTLFAFLGLGYYSMWLSVNYVKQDKFAEYVEKQIDFDKHQDEVLKSRFDVTQTKLENIINNQTIFTEQLRSFNSLNYTYQKELEKYNERLVYVERQTKKGE